MTPRTVAIVPTHLWGLPCDMEAIIELAGQRGLQVIEDCAHALGARYRDRPVGTLGDAAIFSFQTLKPLNAYGGGMAVVRDPALAARVADLAGAEPRPGLKRVKDRLWKGRVLRIATRPKIFTWTLFPIMYIGARLQWSIDMYFWEKIRPLAPLPDDYRERFGNVQAAIKRLGIAYPVAQDNDMATWNAWGNQYWPAKYLIDARGRVRYVHFGEGDVTGNQEQVGRDGDDEFFNIRFRHVFSLFHGFFVFCQSVFPER